MDWPLDMQKHEQRANYEIVLAAVEQNGNALRFASAAVREIVLAAMRTSQSALQYASEELKDGLDHFTCSGANGSRFSRPRVTPYLRQKNPKVGPPRPEVSSDCFSQARVFSQMIHHAKSSSLGRASL